MKKQDSWSREIARRRRLRQLRRSSRKRARLRSRSRIDHDTSLMLALRRDREAFRRQFYRRRYDGPPKAVSVHGDLGIEVPGDVDNFFTTASSLVDFDSRMLTVDLRNCSRVWPSAVTLLCSLAVWAELAARGKTPRIRSLRPSDPAVEAYLQQCGFYDFVGASLDGATTPYAWADVVQIRRETSPAAIEERELEIIGLLERRSSLTSEQIELFDAKVLTEVFNNVTEHGLNHREQGWWIMAQHHPTHKIISICIADNGIGIRHTLLTGPQKEAIRDRVAPDASDDGYIALALNETVSGAIDANLKRATLMGIGPERYDRGAHRGNGLRRIRDTCRELSIPFSLLSQKGLAGVGSDGKIWRLEASDHRIFAGTLYHFVVPA